MRVYAESNFVLEIVRRQEQHAACEELLGLAERSSIELVLPALALFEPYGTLVRNANDIARIRRDLDGSEKALRRNNSKTQDARQLRDASDVLLRAEQEAAAAFTTVRARLLAASHLVPFDAATLTAATALSTELDLELPDAVMLAAVLSDAKSRPSPSLFLNRNTNDFDDPAIRTRLRSLSCDFIGNFDDGLGRVRSSLAGVGSPPVG